MRLKGEAMGFLILTGLLSLTFVVSIVYAAYESGWGKENRNVYYEYWVGNLRYDSDATTTYSDHSVYISNGGEWDVRCIYEFKHILLERPDHENTLYEYTDISSGDSFSLFRTQLMGVGDLKEGQWFTLQAYTDIRLEGKKGTDDPEKAEETLEFQR